MEFQNLFTQLSLHNDAPRPWQLGFQDTASPTAEGITELHDTIMFYLITIAILVFWILGSLILNFNSNKNPLSNKYLTHGTLIELVWTITPALVLIAIAFPSFKLLYLMDEIVSPSITVKVTGSQWYWSYELSDYLNEEGDFIQFESYMVPEADLELGDLRLLEVDNPLVLPINTHVRVLMSSTDVIHDWAVPALGAKLDANPGRLNGLSVLIEREGIYRGQCSELCGIYHGFMPIVVHGVSLEAFLEWLTEQA